MASATSAARRFSYSSPSLFGGQVLVVAARQRNEVRNQRRLDTTRRAGKVKLEATAEYSNTLGQEGKWVEERLHSFKSARELIRQIEKAVALSDQHEQETITYLVSQVLSKWVINGGVLPQEFTAGAERGYGRRALHTDKLGRFGIICMTWSPGQETAIHDHDDMWCVECVYKGRVKISAFDCVPHAGDLFHLYPEQQSFGDVGNAGQLIPPKDVHKISNASEDVAVTIHVYGGHMEKCQIFSPVDQGKEEGSLFKRESKSLYFTSDKPWSEMCG